MFLTQLAVSMSKICNNTMLMTRDVNKDSGFKAKDRTKD